MSRWADWFPVSRSEEEELLNAVDSGDEAVMQLLQPWLESVGELQLPHHVQIDKLWEPIHRCLTEDHTDDLDFEAGDYPFDLCVLGGEPLLMDGSRSAGLISSEYVPDVASELEAVQKSWFRERFFALPNTQFHEINDEIFEWVWQEFQLLPPFFAEAAKQEKAVICTISH